MHHENKFVHCALFSFVYPKVTLNDECASRRVILEKMMTLKQTEKPILFYFLLFLVELGWILTSISLYMFFFVGVYVPFLTREDIILILVRILVPLITSFTK